MTPRRICCSAVRSWLPAFAVAGAILIAGNWWQTRHVPAGLAPEFSAPAADQQPGATLSLSQWRAAHPGQPVALNFWAEWCPFCRVEQGNITHTAERWPVLTIAMRSGDAPSVQRELARRGLAWPAVADPQGEIAARYGVASVPAFIVIDADGNIHSASSGYTTAAGMRLRLWWARWFA